MAYNAQFTSRIREVLKNVPDVEEKKMFRGLVFMVDGKMCITVGDDEMMCRIDPALHEAVVGKNGCRTVVMKGKDYKGYVYVHESVLKSQDQLNYWIGLALDFNKRAKVSKKRGK
jgi:TfoX/Sxy family transcriptional regulator of competence genes